MFLGRGVKKNRWTNQVWIDSEFLNNTIHLHFSSWSQNFGKFSFCCQLLSAGTAGDAFCLRWVYHHSLIDGNEHPICSLPHTNTKRLHHYHWTTTANSRHCWPNEKGKSFKCNISYAASEMSPHLAFWQEETAGCFVTCVSVSSLSYAAVSVCCAAASVTLNVSPINSTLLSVSISPSSCAPVFTLSFAPFLSFLFPQSSSLLTSHSFTRSPSLFSPSPTFPPGAQHSIFWHCFFLLFSVFMTLILPSVFSSLFSRLS